MSPYSDDTALNSAGSFCIRIAPDPDCDNVATPVDAQSGHLNTSVHLSETVIHKAFTIPAKRDGTRPSDHRFHRHTIFPKVWHSASDGVLAKKFINVLIVRIVLGLRRSAHSVFLEVGEWLSCSNSTD